MGQGANAVIQENPVTQDGNVKSKACQLQSWKGSGGLTIGWKRMIGDQNCGQDFQQPASAFSGKVETGFP
jgi:hypothetical protein